MKFTLTAYILALLLTAPVHGFDRAQLHSDRLDPLTDLNQSKFPSNQKNSRTVLSAAEGTDILISESVAPARFEQDGAYMIFSQAGQFSIIWSDARLGRDGIFETTADFNGPSTLNNSLVASASGNFDLVDPVQAEDNTGRTYVAYRDRSRGRIMAQIYKNGLQTALFAVSDTTGSVFAGPFDMAVYPGGRSVFVWEHYSPVGSQIMMAIFDSLGSNIVTPTVVSTGSAQVDHWVPVVALDPTSGFLVVWEDYRNGRADIYARQYNGGGSPIALDFPIVSAPSNLNNQYEPAIAFSSTDDFLIGWVDNSSGQEVYGQRFSLTTGLVGGNFMISDGSAMTTKWYLDLTTRFDNRFLATYTTFGSENSIFVQKFDPAAVPSGSPLKVNSSSSGRRWRPTVATDLDNNVAVAWTEIAADDANIDFVMFDSGLTTQLTSEFLLNDDSLGAPSTDPAITSANSIWSLIAFVDQRRDAGDIYLMGVARNETTSPANLLLNQDIGLNLQTEPVVASDGLAALVVWNDSRKIDPVTGQHIFGRAVTLDGFANGNEFAISNTAVGSIKSNVVTAFSIDNNILTAWMDYRDGDPQVYARWHTLDGAPLSSEFIVSDPINHLDNVDLQAAADISGRVYLIWLDRGVDPEVVRCVWYNSDRSVGGSFAWSSPLANITIDDIAVDVTGDGNIAIAWIGFDGFVGLYLSEIDRTGTDLRSTLTISGELDGSPDNPHLSVSNSGYYSVVWTNKNSDLSEYTIVDPIFVPLSGPTSVTSTPLDHMETPVTAVRDGRVWFAWVDPRADGLNVFANTWIFEPTDVVDNPAIIPDQLALSQNYPNPFNPTTEISFSIPTRSQVRLEVLNLLGQQVRLLENRTVAPGQYSVTWDGRDNDGTPSASGVYFYRLIADQFSQSRKMILLK